MELELYKTPSWIDIIRPQNEIVKEPVNIDYTVASSNKGRILTVHLIVVNATVFDGRAYGA